jgi:hypothetical protein
VGTWAAASVGQPQKALPSEPTVAPRPIIRFNNQTLRQIVHTSIGGSRIRVVLSNTFGTAPLTIGGASVAIRDQNDTIVLPSCRALSFGGRSTIAIPAHGVIISDPVDLIVSPLSDVAIDLYLPGDTDQPSPLTFHNAALQTNYVSGPGNHTGQRIFAPATTVTSWFLLSRVEVMADEPVGAVVVFGAFITDGIRSTPDINRPSPDRLVGRLLERSTPMAVLNAGIAGNRLMSDGQFQQGFSGLARF